MTKLPKYFIIERDERNPLWEKYIDWLNKKYHGGRYWHGIDFKYYGYDGNTTFGTACHNDKYNFINNPTLITLEEWNEAVNGFVLPERWYVRIPNKQIGLIVAEWAGFDWYERLPKYVTYVNFNKTHSDCLNPQLTEITFEQFKKYVLMKDKEIIGYKIKPECEKYKLAASKIWGNFENNWILAPDGTHFLKNSYCYIALKKAQVLDLWFDPVYATKYSLPKINGYNGELRANNTEIKYGCALMSIPKLKRIYEYKDLSIERCISSIRLNTGIEITIKEIKQIIDYVDNQ